MAGKTTAAVRAVQEKAREKFAGPRLPGRPRKDGLPPIQKKKIAAAVPEPSSLEAVALAKATHQLVARIRDLAGKGMPNKYISAMTRVPIEHLEPGGRYAEEITVGKAEAALAVMEAAYERAIEGKSTDAQFWLKCNGGWSDTPAGRKTISDADGDREIAEIQLTVVK